MNKTSKRAAQKHRANAKRFALRRKAEAGQQAAANARAKTTSSASRTRTPRPSEESAESESA